MLLVDVELVCGSLLFELLCKAVFCVIDAFDVLEAGCCILEVMIVHTCYVLCVQPFCMYKRGSSLDCICYSLDVLRRLRLVTPGRGTISSIIGLVMLSLYPSQEGL